MKDQNHALKPKPTKNVQVKYEKKLKLSGGFIGAIKEIVKDKEKWTYLSDRRSIRFVPFNI